MLAQNSYFLGSPDGRLRAPFRDAAHILLLDSRHLNAEEEPELPNSKALSALRSLHRQPVDLQRTRLRGAT